MTVSKDELEIVSTDFVNEETTNAEDAVATNMSAMRKADQRAECIANMINQLRMELNDILHNNCDDTKTKEIEACRINKQLAALGIEYRESVKNALELAESVNFDVDKLRCRKNIEIDLCTKIKAQSTVACNDYESEQLAPYIIVKDVKRNPILFKNDQRLNENTDTDESFCSCIDDSAGDVCDDCDEICVTNNKCCELPETMDTDYEKQAVRDELMVTKGEMKLLYNQNRDLLTKLETITRRTAAASKVLRTKPNSAKCKDNKGSSADVCECTEKKLNPRDLKCEVDRLRDELNEMKRDRCQIELARKVLNVSGSKCANCLGSTDPNENDKIKLKTLTDVHKCVLADRDAKSTEIADLRNRLEEARADTKTCKNCLSIAKIQVTQLEKELFDLKSTKNLDPEVERSNDKYLIENLKHRLHESKAEITKMEMALDMILGELEDKKAKYLAVLQTNQEQKHRLETLCKEKNAIAKEYEDEFNRMDAHLKSRLAEIGELPGMLATAQRDYEKEHSQRIALEKERDTLLKVIESLKASMENETNEQNDKIVNDLQEQKKQLTAMIMTLNANLEENKRLYMERTHYAAQLNEHLNVVREEAAIQVTKVTDFSECQKRHYTDYIQRLETQLANSRAIACSEFKKRDNIQERLRNRIGILTKNLDEAHKKLEEVVKAKNFMDTNTRENLCKVPQIIKTACVTNETNKGVLEKSKES